MIYTFTLQQVAFVLGALYVLSHGLALVQPALCKKFLLVAPRNYLLGSLLMALATGWFTWIMLSIDLMEYTPYRNTFALVGLVGGALVIYYLRELLTGRALGAVLLLSSYILLDAAFLRDEPLRLVLVCAAYAYILAGMVLVSSPYRLRDVLEWVVAREKRFRIAAALGVAFGVLLLILGAVVF